MTQEIYQSPACIYTATDICALQSSVVVTSDVDDTGRVQVSKNDELCISKTRNLVSKTWNFLLKK